VVVLLAWRLPEEETQACLRSHAKVGLLLLYCVLAKVEPGRSPVLYVVEIHIHGEHAQVLVVLRGVSCIAMSLEPVAREIFRQAPAGVQPVGLPDLVGLTFSGMWKPYLGWHDRLHTLIHQGGKALIVGDETEISAIGLRVVRSAETLLLG